MVPSQVKKVPKSTSKGKAHREKKMFVIHVTGNVLVSKIHKNYSNQLGIQKKY